MNRFVLITFLTSILISSSLFPCGRSATSDADMPVSMTEGELVLQARHEQLATVQRGVRERRRSSNGGEPSERESTLNQACANAALVLGTAAMAERQRRGSLRVTSTD